MLYDIVCKVSILIFASVVGKLVSFRTVHVGFTPMFLASTFVCFRAFSILQFRLPLYVFLDFWPRTHSESIVWNLVVLSTQLLMVQLDSKQRTGCTNTNLHTVRTVLKLTRSPLLDFHIYCVVSREQRSSHPSLIQHNCTLSSQCHFITIHGLTLFSGDIDGARIHDLEDKVPR